MADADRPSYAYVALSFVIVAIVWGGTNPLLKRGEDVDALFATPFQPACYTVFSRRRGGGYKGGRYRYFGDSTAISSYTGKLEIHDTLLGKPKWQLPVLLLARLDGDIDGGAHLQLVDFHFYSHSRKAARRVRRSSRLSHVFPETRLLPSVELTGEEQRITPKVVLGTALIAVGVSICVYEKM